MADSDYPAIHGKKGGFPYIAYLPYYPKRYEVDNEHETIRNVIYGFKNGTIPNETANALSGSLRNDLNSCSPFSDWWFCVIPASTESKTIIRFEIFVKKICEILEFNNGFHLIFNREDRSAIHNEENRNSINIIDYVNFQNIAGKKIVLFDDLYTTGKSFLKVASKLIELGATSVYGLFLGKTYWPDEFDPRDFAYYLDEDIGFVKSRQQTIDQEFNGNEMALIEAEKKLMTVIMEWRERNK